MFSFLVTQCSTLRYVVNSTLVLPFFRTVRPSKNLVLSGRLLAEERHARRDSFGNAGTSEGKKPQGETRTRKWTCLLARGISARLLLDCLLCAWAQGAGNRPHQKEDGSRGSAAPKVGRSGRRSRSSAT